MSEFYESPTARPVRFNLLAFALLAVALAAAYANTFTAPFVFDGVALEASLRHLALAEPTGWLRQPPRTVGYFTFDLQHTLHGNWLPGFHAVNLLIHLASAWLLYWAVIQSLAIVSARTDTAASVNQQQAWSIGLTAATIFALHPLQTQSVTYLYQRFEALMGMFFLAAVCCFIRALRDSGSQRTVWLLASWACVLLSIGTKEVGAMAPFVILWYDRAVAGVAWKTIVRQRWWYYLFFLAIWVGGIGFLYARRLHYAQGGIFDPSRMGVWDYACSQPGAVLLYLRLFCWPQGQSLDHALPIASGLYEVALPAVAIAALLAATGWLAWYRPPLGFLLGSFFLILAPTSSFAPIIDIAYEHRMYLAIAPLSVLVAVIIVPQLLQLTTAARSSRGQFRAVMVSPLLACLLLGPVTAARNEVYRSRASVWEDVLTKNPDNQRAMGNLAWNIQENPADQQRAINLHRRALSRNPTFAVSHRGLGILLAGRDRDAAINHAQTALKLEPSDWENANNLGILLAPTDPEETERLFRTAIQQGRRQPEPVYNLVKLLIGQQRYAEAAAILSERLDAAAPADDRWKEGRRLLGLLRKPESATPRPAAETAAPPAPAAR